MPQLENDIAGLRTITYLLGEALRIADERKQLVVSAKIGSCLEQVEFSLADALAIQQRRSTPRQ